MEVTKDYRPDCHAQTALIFYLYSLYTKDISWEKRAHNLLNYLFENGYQDTDENSKTYGFWKWFNFPEKYPENIFTDDNSWVCITLLYLYKQTGKEEYKKRGLMTAEALLRTQNENGLRAEQLLGSKLRKYGLDYVKSAPMSMNPHFESIAHVAFILAYQVSNNEKYLETAYRGTKYLLENKSQMKWMYSLTSANSRFLLAISALLRYKDDDVLKHGLNDIIKYLKSNHHRRGGVEEADNPDPERLCVHTSNSAASIREPHDTHQAIRFGVAMYGLYPSEDIYNLRSIQLRRAFSLHSEIIHIKKVKKDSIISYGATYTARDDEWIATLPIGYADGWSRSLQGFHVLIDGKKCEIVGHICMDQMMIKVDQYYPIGTKATLIGEQKGTEIAIDEVAE